MGTDELILAGSLSIIMAGMGLSLTVADFKRVLIYPKAVAIGTILKVLLLPLITYGILLLVPDFPFELAVGFVLLAACPGGATSNFLAGLAKSDVALSITLTAIASVVTVFTIPLFTNYALAHMGATHSAVDLPLLETIFKIFGITIVPVTIGMFINGFAPKLASKIDRPVRIISILLLILIIIGLVVKNKDQMGTLVAAAGPLSVVINIVALVIGYGGAKLFKLSEKQAITIAIETSVINGALGIAIASTMVMGGLGENPYAFPAAVYSLVMYAGAGALVWWGNKKLKEIEY